MVHVSSFTNLVAGELLLPVRRGKVYNALRSFANSCGDDLAVTFPMGKCCRSGHKR
jgi:hypothetical protein